MEDEEVVLVLVSMELVGRPVADEKLETDDARSLDLPFLAEALGVERRLLLLLFISIGEEEGDVSVERTMEGVEEDRVVDAR